MAKNRMPLRQKNVNTVKNAVTILIKNISIIAIFLSIGIIALLYLGPEINLNGKIVFRLAVPSVVLAVSITIINELWITNGRQNAREENDYQKLIHTYGAKSDGLYYPALQDSLDYEYERRYQVEYDRLTRMLNRETAVLEKTKLLAKSRLAKSRLVIWYKTKKIRRQIRHIEYARNTIKVFIPYEKAEEFDYLRYNIQDIIYKEYSPNDTKKHLAKARVKKYTSTFTFAVGGLNALSIGGSMGDPWAALIMTTLAALAILFTVVGGFTTGYNNVKIVSTGVYNTANTFLDQAVAYCKRTSKDLYYKGTTEFRLAEPVILSPNIPELISETESPEETDIFTKATIEVTRTDK